MKGFLRAALERSLLEHEERMSAARGVDLPKDDGRAPGVKSAQTSYQVQRDAQARQARRRQQVESMRAEGMSMREIARALGITERAVHHRWKAGT